MNIPNYLYSVIHNNKQYFFTMGDLNKHRETVDRWLQESGQPIIPLRLERWTDQAATYVAKDGWKVIATI